VQDKTEIQALMFANRLQKRFRHLKKWAQRANIGAFRLYDRDIPEIPLVLDFYGDVAQLQEAALSGALYKRPYEKDDNEEEHWLLSMKNSASLALGIKPEYIFLKQRKRQRGISQYEKMDETHFTKIINEGNLVFRVNLSDYLDTGLFPDRRLLRVMVRNEAAGKKVLNLFSYTGSFSVYAASGGAVSTDSIDLSNTYLNWARDNFSLNGFSANLLPRLDQQMQTHVYTTNANDEKKTIITDFHRSRVGAHQLIRYDVLEFIEKAAAAKMRWDIIILDPPAFSNSKKMADNFDLQRDIKEMLNQCLKLLAPGGKIFLSINMRTKAPIAAELEEDLCRQSLPHTANAHVTDLENKIADEDFKGRKIPKAFLITVE